MFDTLPIVLEESEMRRGDLVFVEAPMYSGNGLKNHKHNITHIEVRCFCIGVVSMQRRGGSITISNVNIYIRPG